MNHPVRNRVRHAAFFGLMAFVGISGALAVTATADAASITLTPFGTVGGSAGINEHWVQVTSTWQGPSYNSSGASATALDGISSLADASAALSLPASNSNVLATFDGVQPGPINYANTAFNTDPYSQPAYGTGTLPPLFNASTPSAQQINYAGHFWGFLNVPTSGLYNFGVLADDGFTFTLTGANGNFETMGLDGLNTRTYTYFGTNLNLSGGLYRYDLIGYNRLQNGVVRLLQGSGTGAWNPTTISAGNFYTSIAPVPLPPSVWLLGSGLIGLAAVGRRRHPGQRPNRRD
ncbi:MAG: VPLPA-CTERM sorting domain-containing protein [Gammaproteobacteria bacterium]|nr:VPLPA-CTERM sorting domain-containing protein [Gammaproteobacteria bacterium]